MTSFAISVPVGAYHPFLPVCLKSLAAQRVPVKVALLDASDDPRVKELADRFSSVISYRRHGPDDGQSAAIIEGWQNIDGEILGWLNADDVLFPNALSKVLETLEEHIDLVYGHSTVCDEDGAVTGYHWGVAPPGDMLLQSNTISQPSCFFRRETYHRIGGLNPSLHYTMDWELWIRFYKADAKFRFVEDTLSQVMWGRMTKTASFNQRRQDELQSIISAHAPVETHSRIMKSIARESRIDRLPGAFLRFIAGRFFARGRPRMKGFSGVGEIRSEAQISLAHYLDGPAAGLRIRFKNGDAIDEVYIDGEAQDFHVSKTGLEIDLHVAPATTIMLRIVMKPGRYGRFVRAEWRA